MARKYPYTNVHQKCTSEQNVPVKLMWVSLPIPSSSWLLEPMMLVESIHVARVLLPDKDPCAAVHVANSTSRPYTLPAGTEVGQVCMALLLTNSTDSELSSQPIVCDTQSDDTVRWWRLCTSPACHWQSTTGVKPWGSSWSRSIC